MSKIKTKMRVKSSNYVIHKCPDCGSKLKYDDKGRNYACKKCSFGFYF